MKMIYEILCNENGKRYLGSTINHRERFAKHKMLLKRNTHHSKRLQNSWNKYGPTTFVFRILESVVGDLKTAEQNWLNRTTNSFNTADESIAPMRGKKHSSITKEKLRLLSTGRRFSPETRARLSKAKTGVRFSRKHKENISKSWNIDREARCMAISKATKGRVISQSQKDSVSLRFKGSKLSTEHKNKIRGALIGHSVSQATRDKISKTKMLKRLAGE